jgi:hypothetical protein
MPPVPVSTDALAMAIFLLEHRHEAAECAVVFAAWKGFDTPLRRQPVLCSCRSEGHRLWFVVTGEQPRKPCATCPDTSPHGRR